MSLVQNVRFLRAFGKFTDSIGKDGSLMNWLASIVALATAAVSIFSTQIQAFEAKHAALSASLLSVYAIFTHLLPSPMGTTPAGK
jgi:hypothetical protein